MRPGPGESNGILITQYVDENNDSHLRITSILPTHIYYAVGMLNDAITALLNSQNEWITSEFEEFEDGDDGDSDEDADY